MSKNVLITAGGHADIPIIDALHKLGFSVISTGLNTDGLGHKKADIYEPADFSDKETMLRLAEKYHVSNVIAGCNDFAYLSAAYVAERLGFKGFDSYSTAVRIHQKDSFRRLQRECGVRYPKFFVCAGKEALAEAKSALRLPVVIKPVDLTGGKGVEICATWDAVERQVDETLEISRESRFILEEYVEGENHGTSMLLRAGRVAFAFFDNEEYFKNRYLVSGAYAPSDLSKEQKKDVINQVETLARRAGLCDGLFHCQLIVSRGGIPYLIDPCRRTPGDLYVNLVSYAAGIDYPMAIVKGQLGLSMDEELAFTPINRYIAREVMMAETNGLIERIVIDSDYERHIFDKMLWLHPGDRIENYMKDKAGIVFFEFADAAELKRYMKNLHHHMRIEVNSQS